MNVRKIESEEAGKIVRELWLPLAREMEQVSDYNKLRENLDIDEVIEHKKEKLSDDETFAFLAEGEEPAGFLTAKVKDAAPIFSRGHKLKIDELFIREEFRRQGIASRLLRRAEEVAESENVDTIELSVDRDNKTAREFYRDSGFETERLRMVKDA